MIDWDKVAEADITYTDWNYDAADWMAKARESLTMSPLEARRQVEEGLVEEGEIFKINDLDNLIMYKIRNEFDRSRDGDGGLEDWIGQHIQIVKKDDKWTAEYYSPPKKK